MMDFGLAKHWIHIAGIEHSHGKQPVSFHVLQTTNSDVPGHSAQLPETTSHESQSANRTREGSVLRIYYIIDKSIRIPHIHYLVLSRHGHRYGHVFPL